MAQTRVASATASAPAGPPPYTRMAAGLKPILVFTSLEIIDPAVARRFDRLSMSFGAKTKLMQLMKEYKYVAANKQKIGPKVFAFQSNKFQYNINQYRIAYGARTPAFEDLLRAVMQHSRLRFQTPLPIRAKRHAAHDGGARAGAGTATMLRVRVKGGSAIDARRFQQLLAQVDATRRVRAEGSSVDHPMHV